MELGPSLIIEKALSAINAAPLFWDIEEHHEAPLQIEKPLGRVGGFPTH